MIETPQIVELPAQHTAIMRVKVAREQLNSAVPPAIEQVLVALAERQVEPTGPLVMRHLSMAGGMFDFEIGFPVAAPFEAVGDVVPSELPATRAVATVHQGSYDLLHSSWTELQQWLKSHPELKPAPHLWESYVVGPESGLDTAEWKTELFQPLSE